jgi:hypothetical protein
MKFDTAFVVRFLLAALAVYRVAMFAHPDEDGAFAIFHRIRVWTGKLASTRPEGGWAWTLAGIANCPHCAGVWFAIIFAPAVIWHTVYTDVIILVLALAGLQSFMTGRSNVE